MNVEETLYLSLSEAYLFLAVNGLLEPDELHHQAVSMETQALWCTRHILSQTGLWGTWEEMETQNLADAASSWMADNTVFKLLPLND